MIIVMLPVTRIIYRHARIFRSHGHGACRLSGWYIGRGEGWRRLVGIEALIFLGFLEHDGSVAIEDSVIGAAACDAAAAGRGVEIVMPGVVLGEIRCEVADEGVERLGAEELQSVLPLLGADEGRVTDNLEARIFQHVVQLLDPQLLACLHHSLKLVEGAGLGGDLIDVMVKGLGILYGGRNGVKAVMESSIEVVPLQAELPEWPSPARIVHGVVVGVCLRIFA